MHSLSDPWQGCGTWEHVAETAVPACRHGCPAVWRLTELGGPYQMDPGFKYGANQGGNCWEKRIVAQSGCVSSVQLHDGPWHLNWPVTDPPPCCLQWAWPRRPTPPPTKS